MRAVFLDSLTLGTDIDLTPLTNDGNQWQLYSSTEPSQVASRIEDAEIVVSNKVVISEDLIANSQNLKFIAVPATGTNNIPLLAAKNAGIPVSNCTAYGTPSVAQHVFTLMLALSTKLIEYNHAVLRGDWGKSSMFCLLDYPIAELSGKTLGIVGYGELGQGVARIARAFDMTVLIANRPGQDKITEGRIPLNELLPMVDVLSLNCPLTAETSNLISSTELALMKKEALLINCARGGIVNEDDLASALKNGIIGGAGVDVLLEEPPRNGNVLLDHEIPNLIVTPHSAWGSREARQRIVGLTAKNIKSFLIGEGRSIVNDVNPAQRGH